jgi:hypothetical protein
MRISAKERNQLETFLQSMHEIYKVTRRDYLLLKIMAGKEEYIINDIIKMNNALAFLSKISAEDVEANIKDFQAGLLSRTSLNVTGIQTTKKKPLMSKRPYVRRKLK